MSRLALVLLLALPAAAAERPLYYERPVTPADLDGRSLRELTLMRNWIFARRGNAFRRPWLDTFFRAQRWYSVKDPISTAGLSADEVVLDDKNAVAIGDFEAALTMEQLLALRDAVRARVKAAGKPSADDAIELRLLSARLGGWAGEGAAPPDLTPLENPERLGKLLKLGDLDGLSGRDLKLLRNTIFARHGRPFTTDLVRGHFKTVSWYAPDEKYADARLTEIDKKNVKLILSLEDKLKRPPPKDERPDGWYVAA